jgi:lipopolysaccharide transport system permease protein
MMMTAPMSNERGSTDAGASAAPPLVGRETVIRPVRAFSWDDLVEIWRYRELLWTLAVRDVRVRYKQAALGIGWALLQPVAQMVIFTILFHRFAGIQTDIAVPYPVFCFSGLVVWAVFANGLAYASDSLVQSGDMVTKVYFPRVIMPLAAVGTAVIDFLVASVLLVVLAFALGAPLHATALLALPIAALAALSAISVGLWTAAINVRFRDVRYALPFFFQIMVYLTPVFYPTTLVPVRWRPLLLLNPMAAVVDGFRAALFGTPLPLARLGLSTLSMMIVGTLGFIVFRRLEQTFADRI